MSKPLLSELCTLAARFRECERLVLALDFDGTLAPIAARPQGASLPQRTLMTLRRLASSDGVSLVIVSGRSLADLKQKLSIRAIHIGNHGFEIEGDAISFVHQEAEGLHEALEDACVALEEALRGVPGILVERKRLTATVHYRRSPADLHTWVESTVRLVLRPYRPLLEIRPARKAWEVRPHIAWNKGCAVRFVMDRIASRGATLVCAGDDDGDEDLFNCYPGAISIKVGDPQETSTTAQYHVGSPLELANFLELLSFLVRSSEGF